MLQCEPQILFFLIFNYVWRCWVFIAASLVAQMVEPACNVGDLASVPRLGRSPEEGNDNPLQYSCWRIPWTEETGGLQSMGLQKSWTGLSN